MSLIFTPKIDDKYRIDPAEKLRRSTKKRVTWNKAEMDQLIALRAMHIPYTECEKLLNMTQGSCAVKLHFTGGLAEVEALRKKLISDIMRNDDD